MSVSRNKIIDASVKLFSELGYHRTSMDDIAKEANVAKGTLYYHFTGKGELFETIVTEGFQLLRNQIREVLDENQSPDNQIRSIVRKHCELFLQYSELVHILSNEITNGIETEVLTRIVALKNEYVAFLADILRQGHADGELNPLHYELAAASMLGMIESATMYVIRRRDSGEATAELLHETIDAFVLPALLKTR
ncbi:TetR/AcrR family transcriptional regulator [Cohnella soli]|uniref:TetR/AcrR family transcriptional regulator n=1 Tax=Cohnella soli TaxID=425005 RepID=A0ABW0HTT4_9BACL